MIIYVKSTHGGFTLKRSVAIIIMLDNTFMLKVGPTASIKMREIDPSHVKEAIVLPARW